MNPADRASRAAVFFDRDNTLIASDGYLGDPKQVVLIDGAAAALSAAHELGYAVVVVSNQSGVARGYFDEEAVRKVNAQMDRLLIESNPLATVDHHEFCPFHPQAKVEKYRKDSALRKPAPGMLLAAANMLNLDLPASWMIGDAPRDIQAGRAAGCKTILFTAPDLPSSPAAHGASAIAADFQVQTLSAAIDIIRNQTHRKNQP